MRCAARFIRKPGKFSSFSQPEIHIKEAREDKRGLTRGHKKNKFGPRSNGLADANPVPNGGIGSGVRRIIKLIEEFYMNKVYLVLALILALSVAGAAQQQKKSGNRSVSGSANSSSSASSKTSVSRKNGQNGDSGRTISLDSATNVAAQLQSTLDVKRAQVGDEVILKTTKAIKQNGETIIPKGSSLIGHVTEVQQRTKGNAMSKLGLVFDRVEGKNLSEDVVATVVSITNAQAASNLGGDTLGSDVMGSSSTSARGSAHSSSGGGLLGGGSGGGGLLGGVGNTAGGLVGGVTQTVGGVANTATQTVGGVTNTAAQTLGGATNAVGQTINGITISQSASGSANGSTTLSSPNKNVRLEKGVTFNLQLDSSAEAN